MMKIPTQKWNTFSMHRFIIKSLTSLITYIRTYSSSEKGIDLLTQVSSTLQNILYGIYEKIVIIFPKQVKSRIAKYAKSKEKHISLKIAKFILTSLSFDRLSAE